MRARDIDAPSNVEVVNPDHYIATLDDDNGRLDMELTVERHRGYLPVENRDPVPIGAAPGAAPGSTITAPGRASSAGSSASGARNRMRATRDRLDSMRPLCL